MELGPGGRLGPYEILSRLGTGGMGEVWRARDGRLGREVALKVLPADVSQDEGWRQRFEREARSAARFSHPHVCAIYDVGRDGPRDYLVLELLQGETLAARLAGGPLPFDEVLRLGTQIAQALAAAHAAGIVHRDLKPGNVMLTASGVKLLDFGLAKRVESPAASAADGLDSTAGMGLTQAGAVLGTGPYMSPEQATGKSVDARTDIFALGAVLYEMATGRRAFPGASHAEALGAVLTREPPPPSTLGHEIPRWFDQLVALCLAKDPSERWESAHDLAIRLRTPPTGPELQGDARGARRGPWLAATFLLGVLLGAGVVALLRSRPPQPEPPVRLAQAPPPGTRIFHNREVTSIAVSPDGRRIAFITYRSGVPSVWLRPEGRQVWIRELAAAEASPVPLTEGATSVFWSPDGESLGFVVPGAMKRIAIAGGPPVVICPLERQVGYAASWGADGRIVFGSIIGDGLFEVPAAGGEPRLLLRPDRTKGEFAFNWPIHIPGNRLLFLARKADSAWLMLLPPGKAARPVMPVKSRVQLVDPGVLVYVRDGTLVAQRFDLDAGEVRGEPWALASHTRSFESNGSAEFAASPGGTLVWQPMEDVQSLRWLDRTGEGLGRLGENGVWNDVSISPSGGAVLASRARYETGILDVWSFDLTTGGAGPVATRPFTECFALWHPSGTQLVYSATEGGPPHLRRKDLTTGEDVELRPRGSFQIAQSFSPDGRTLLFTQRVEKGGQRAWEMPFQVGAEPTLLPLGEGDTWNVRFSPDGEYLAYVSSESGRGELSIARHGRLAPPVPVSSSGALLARWSARTGEILYMSPDGKVWAVPVSTRPTLRVSRPTLLFQLPPDRLWYDFDVTPDGRRFLAVIPEVQADEHALEIVVHPTTAPPGG